MIRMQVVQPIEDFGDDIGTGPIRTAGESSPRHRADRRRDGGSGRIVAHAGSRAGWHPAMSAPAGGAVDVPDGLHFAPGPCVVTIGVFDGVHRGHARLIERTVARARSLRLPAVMVTFDPHPALITGPPRDTSTLSTPRRRAELAERLGIDAILVLPFTPRLAQMSAADFVRHMLVGTLRARAVVVGNGFTFGAGGAGNLDVLRHLGQRYGYTAESVDLLQDADTRYSSTYIRRCIAAGDIDAATAALGRPHRIQGVLHRHTLSIAAGTAVPPPGRYRATVTGGGAFGAPTGVTVVDQHRLVVDCPPPVEVPGLVVEIDFVARTGPGSTPSRAGAVPSRGS